MKKKKKKVVSREKLKSKFRKLSKSEVFDIFEASRQIHEEMEFDKNSNELREQTGFVKDDRLLVGFLYVLMRDEVAPGRISRILLGLSNEQNRHENETNEIVFTNGYLAQYAQYIADKIERNIKTQDSID